MRKLAAAALLGAFLTTLDPGSAGVVSGYAANLVLTGLVVIVAVWTWDACRVNNDDRP